MSSLLTITVILNAFQAGFLPRLWDVIAEPTAQRLGLPSQKLVQLRRAVLLGMILLFPWCGLLVDRLGSPGVLLLGNVLAALSIFWLAQGRTLGSLGMAAFLLGLAEAMVGTGVVLLMRQGLCPARPVLMSLNLGFLAVAAGYLLTPSLVGSLRRQLGEIGAMITLALGCLAPALLAGLVSTNGDPASPPPVSLTVLLADPRWWLMAGLGLVFFPLERWLFAWKNRVFDEPGRKTLWPTVGFLAGFLGLRLFFGLVDLHLHGTWILVGLASCYAVVLGNLLGSYRPREAGLGFLLLGGCFGPMLPTLLSVLFQLFPSNPASAAGLLLGIGSLSCLVLDPILDSLTRKRSLKVIMKVSMFSSLVWGMIAVVLALVR